MLLAALLVATLERLELFGARVLRGMIRVFVNYEIGGWLGWLDRRLMMCLKCVAEG
jgi:hypothetical protein